jgi:hypothetical protein
MRAVNAFFIADHPGFFCINGALITLLPKKPEAMEPKDFRPISLIHSIPKLLAKLMANRLSPYVDDLVLCNQSAFIRGRLILKSFKYVQRSAVMLKKRRVPRLLLKLDISKAFDTVSWRFVPEVLQAWVLMVQIRNELRSTSVRTTSIFHHGVILYVLINLRSKRITSV